MRILKLTNILPLLILALVLGAPATKGAPGDLDTTFDPGLILWEGFDFPAFKYAAVLQSDGKLVIGGHFDTVGGVSRVFIARLNANGSLDASFEAPLQAITINGSREGEVYDILQQPDGKFIVSGYFNVGGQWKTVVRLNNDGSLDGTFNVTTNNGSTNFNHIYRMLLQPDGKIVIGSNALQSVNGTTTGYLARLTTTGALDTALGVTGQISFPIFALALQSDGKIIAAGGFGAIGRLLTDGTPDKGWTYPDVGLGSVHCLAIEPDGQILAGSNSRFTVNGVQTDGLIRLNTNGSIDFTFNPPDIRIAWTLYVQSDGKIAVGGSFTINFGLFLSTFGRLNPDGSLDFMCNSGPDNDLQDIVRQPDGRYIVAGTFETYFQGNEQVVRTGVARVLEAPSPLTGKIVYNSRPDGINLEIYSMDPDGSNQTRLTTNEAADYDPALSTDATRIAFVSDRDKNDEIYVMNSDGTGQTRLTNNVDRDLNPSWSRDGTKIVFSSLRDGNWEIYVMDSNGANQTRLTTNTSLDDEPSFSPDGSKIVFRSNRDGNPEIYVMDANGANQTRFTFHENVDNEPVFSPDGSRIAFRSFRDGNSEIYVMNENGSHQWNVSRNAAADYHPSFSPDGSRIAFATDRNAGQVEIYVMNWVGSDPVRYTTNSVEDSRPSWAGGGKSPPPGPVTRLKIDSGNMLIGSPGSGLLLRSPNGMACTKLSIDNAGALVATPVPCP
jgi:uncharacterized delta-60 repeat protein